MKLSQLLFVSFALVLALAVFACVPKQEQGKYKIALTIAPTQTLIEDLLDSTILQGLEFRVLLPDGAIPESYEPTVDVVAFLERCDAWYYVGDLGFETQWIERVRQFNPNIKLIRLDKGLKHIHAPHWHGDMLHNVSDPHYWVSVEGLAVMLGNVRVALQEALGIEVKPHKYKNLIAHLEQAEANIKAENERRKLEQGQRPAFLVYHPALSYYARGCGFEQWVIEQEGKEPTPQHMAELSKLWKPFPKLENKAPTTSSMINLIAKNPKIIILREYRDVTRAIADTYGLDYALSQEGVFELDVFDKNLWQIMAKYLYGLDVF